MDDSDYPPEWRREDRIVIWSCTLAGIACFLIAYFTANAI